RALGVDMPWLVLVAGLTVAAVYWLNIFNFMDGIDGIAGAQAVFMLLGAVLLAVTGPGAGGGPQRWWVATVAASTPAFLVLNWPPATISTGDARSTYLGFVLAYTALSSLAGGWLTPWRWLILGALFLADATLTLLRRLLRGEPIFRAH